MIPEFCAKLKEKLIAAALPFGGTIAGAVKAVTYYEETMEGQKLTYVLPVAWHTNAGTNVPEQELVPNGDKLGIVYFEENGARLIGNNPGGDEYEALITLVAWYNKTKVLGEGNEYVHIQSNYITLVKQALKINTGILNLYPFTRVRLSLNSVQPQDGRIFAQYTYRETDRQYLMPPFEYFALDMTARFTVSSCAV
jgi:hypothetical protein